MRFTERAYTETGCSGLPLHRRSQVNSVTSLRFALITGNGRTRWNVGMAWSTLSLNQASIAY